MSCGNFHGNRNENLIRKFDGNGSGNEWRWERGSGGVEMGLAPRGMEGNGNIKKPHFRRPLSWLIADAVYVVRDSYGDECDAKPVMSERDSFVRISVTDADDHTTQQITESRTRRAHSFSDSR